MRFRPGRTYTKLRSKTPLNQLECNLSFGLHLLQNPDCAVYYRDRQFSILAKARTQLHVAALKAIFVKTQPPILFRQKGFRLLSSNFTVEYLIIRWCTYKV